MSNWFTKWHPDTTHCFKVYMLAALFKGERKYRKQVYLSSIQRINLTLVGFFFCWFISIDLKYVNLEYSKLILMPIQLQKMTSRLQIVLLFQGLYVGWIIQRIEEISYIDVRLIHPTCKLDPYRVFFVVVGPSQMPSNTLIWSLWRKFQCRKNFKNIKWHADSTYNFKACMLDEREVRLYKTIPSSLGEKPLLHTSVPLIHPT